MSIRSKIKGVCCVRRRLTTTSPSLSFFSDLLLVSHSQLEDDIWCIEPYANLALCVSKETYERLGLVGHKLPSKHRSGERYGKCFSLLSIYYCAKLIIHIYICAVIGIPLRKNVQSPKNMERVRAALARWDDIRQADLGKDRELWDVVYCSRSEFWWTLLTFSFFFCSFQSSDHYNFFWSMPRNL